MIIRTHSFTLSIPSPFRSKWFIMSCVSTIWEKHLYKWVGIREWMEIEICICNIPPSLSGFPETQMGLSFLDQSAYGLYKYDMRKKSPQDEIYSALRPEELCCSNRVVVIFSVICWETIFACWKLPVLIVFHDQSKSRAYTEQQEVQERYVWVVDKARERGKITYL